MIDEFEINNEEMTESILDSFSDDFKPENAYVSISPAKWDSFLKTIEFFAKDSDDAIIIRKSIIVQKIGGAILKADVSEILGDDIDLHIISPKKWLRLFKTFKDRKNYIYIIDNQEESIYIVTDGSIRLFLPKIIDTVVKTLEFPKLENIENLINITIDKSFKDTIYALSKSGEYVEFLITNSKLKAINIPNVGLYVFSEYRKEKDIDKLNSKNADLSLRSSIFLPISADEYTITFGRNKNTGIYCLYTLCQNGRVETEIFEDLDESTGGNLFI